MNLEKPFHRRDAAQEAFLQRLLERGVVERIPPPLTPDTVREEHDPIPIEGKPISQEIIEGRR